jgi:hypothetical protein
MFGKICQSSRFSVYQNFAKKINRFCMIGSLETIETEARRADFTGWCIEAGFKRCEVLPLGGPASAAIAYK